MFIKNTLWHLDGALFATTSAIREALLDSLTDLGLSVAAADLDDMLLQNDLPLLMVAARRYGVDYNTLVYRYQRFYGQILLRDQGPQPGALDICCRVVEAGGSNYLFTDRQRPAVELLLAAFGMTGLFAGWLTASAGYPVQHDFSTLVTDCRLVPAETLVISNRPADIEIGRTVGLWTCLYSQTGEAHQADWVVASYDVLPGQLYQPVGVV